MRIQILPLPSLMVDDDLEEPFALLVDQWEGTPAENAAVKEFGLACGARAVMTTPFTAEIVDRHAEPDTSEIDRLAAYLLEHFDGEIGEGSAVDNAIRLLNSVLLRRDAAKIKAELGFMLKSRQQQEPPRPADAQQRLRDAGKAARAELGIAGSMWAASGVPHAYNDYAGESPFCIVCGLDQQTHAHGRGESVESSDEGPGERSLMDDLPARLHPLAAAVGIPDRPVDPRERAREWIAGFLATTDEDRVNCVALLLGAADDALRCAVNHKGRDEDEQEQG